MQIKLERGRCERPPPPSVRTHITTLSSLSCSLSKACCGATAGGGDGFAAISLLHPPLPTATPAAAGPGAQEPLNSRVDGSSNNNSRSFCVEIGSVSNRRSSAAGDDLRTYSLGSFDYRVDEEVQAVVSHITCPAVSAAAAKSATPVEALAEAAGSSGWRADAAWRRRGPADAAGWRRRGGCGGDRRRHWRFVPKKFEKIFQMFSRSEEDTLSWLEVEKMLIVNRDLLKPWTWFYRSQVYKSNHGKVQIMIFKHPSHGILNNQVMVFKHPSYGIFVIKSWYLRLFYMVFKHPNDKENPVTVFLVCKLWRLKEKWHYRMFRWPI
ncbi:hypothetical protein SETIT_4G111600v2 [Setaria italica]|uniref:Uncharacterized protein n=1 Tax=Setaria italica TaxID=4555 RepID=A0A368QTB9_SETIT|nr:hypothetical protein SETIT_4G111600v2 [Setaria italica]